MTRISVTESSAAAPDWRPILRDIARASGHELRNALNALVVNLEVVRSRTLSLDDSVRSFVDQSVEQADQSAGVAEGTIALLNLLVDAIDASGRVAAQNEDGGIRIEGSEGEISRLHRALAALRSRNVLTSDAIDSAVILRIPGKQPVNQDK